MRCPVWSAGSEVVFLAVGVGRLVLGTAGGGGAVQSQLSVFKVLTVRYLHRVRKASFSRDE